MIVAGIDIGSLWSKVIILEEEIIRASIVRRSGLRMLDTAKAVFQEACEKAKISSDKISNIVATGYGRVKIPWATKSVTEITCHARGINFFRDSIRTLIDIGGQDSKVIKIDEKGKVVNFLMNDKCAAGTGRFVEVMAEAAGISLEEIGHVALNSTRKIEISSVCTIFAESEVISLVSEGVPVEDIMAAITRSIVERVVRLAIKLGIEPECAITGGLGRNQGVLTIWEEKTGTKLWSPSKPQMAGALGAALIAAELN